MVIRVLHSSLEHLCLPAKLASKSYLKLAQNGPKIIPKSSLNWLGISDKSAKKRLQNQLKIDPKIGSRLALNHPKICRNTYLLVKSLILKLEAFETFLKRIM
jgi:hypothetical protein